MPCINLLQSKVHVLDAADLRLAHHLGAGCLTWLLHGPDPCWNPGSRRIAHQALERHRLIDGPDLTARGRAVQHYLRRQRGLDT